MSKGYDVIIIGGGVIGCSVAHSLSERGHSVAVFEKGTISGEASKAAAGLLGVQAEWNEYDPLFELARKSRALFPKLAARLREKTGIDIAYEEKGIYRIAENEEEAKRLEHIMKWQLQTGEETHLLSGEQLREQEPELALHIISALYCPKDGHVIAPELTRALAHSAALSGTAIYEGTEVIEILQEQDRVTGVVTTEGTFSCSKVIVASGAWSTNFLQNFHSTWGTYPIMGEMVSVKSYKPLLKAPIFQDGFYVVPKRGGQYLIGATVKQHTYNKTVCAKSIAYLMERAFRLVPALQQAEWDTAWAGLRPQSNHGMPYMGEHPEVAGLYACAGHYRNGILLSPITGEYMADLIEGKHVQSLLETLLSKEEFV